jgi:hypothetical protein
MMELLLDEIDERQRRREREIAQTKRILLQQYAVGTASAEDWLA